MLNSLYLYHGPPLLGSVESLRFSQSGFVLQTCQRFLMVSLAPLELKTTELEVYRGPSAYRLLLEIICGLHSKLLGETEVLAQFRQAFQNYLASAHSQSELIKIFEKVLKDAKEVRTRYLIGIGKNSYGGLIRKMLQSEQGTPVLVLGSGDLAYQVFTNLKKHHPLVLSARNPETMAPLLEKFGPQVIPWRDYQSWADYTLIVNTIGSEDSFLSHDNFILPWASNKSAQKRKLIDLGSPSPLSSPWATEQGIIRLQEIFQMVGDLSVVKNYKISQARDLIDQLATKREKIFSLPEVSIPSDFRYL